MIESEYIFLEELLASNKLDGHLKQKVIEFFSISDKINYQIFIKKFNLNIDKINAFSDIKDKIAYVLVEEYFESEKVKNKI